MELSEYVPYLRKMLEDADNNEINACHHCPMENLIGLMEDYEKEEFCTLCQTFVGLTPMADPEDWGIRDSNHCINPKCPCARPQGDNPVSRAWYYIYKYEKENPEGD